MLGKLYGKSAVVTGGTRGIGRVVAHVLAAEGARVMIVAGSAKNGARIVTEIEELGGVAHFFQADVSDKRRMMELGAYTVDRCGSIDILCSNAGIFPSSLIEDMAEEDWDRVCAVNLKGTYLAVQACLPQMKLQEYGRIVFTSSITGPITGFPGWSHYGATKAGMLGFMRSAALEVARYGITVNAVLPGNIRTEGLTDLGEDYIRRTEHSIPMGRLGDPEDVAYAILFLVSDEARYITGQTIIIDGGQTLPESVLGLA
ncbi:MAG: 3-oxoacyl-ACP reductase FabG [Thermodesulfobacteriota bacterium]